VTTIDLAHQIAQGVVTETLVGRPHPGPGPEEREGLRVLLGQ
jgi:hypothetical protein